jgi:hypothetical protein
MSKEEAAEEDIRDVRIAFGRAFLTVIEAYRLDSTHRNCDPLFAMSGAFLSSVYMKDFYSKHYHKLPKKKKMLGEMFDPGKK